LIGRYNKNAPRVARLLVNASLPRDILDFFVKIDLTKVPSKKLIKSLIEKLKKDYPNLHKVLIEERNIILAKNLNKLLSTNKTIVAVIGAGHTEEVLDLIKNENK